MIELSKSKLDFFLQHSGYCIKSETYPCDCGKDEAEAELAGLRGRLDKLELVRLIAVDVEQWLRASGRGGTAHQLQLSDALKGTEQ